MLNKHKIKPALVVAPLSTQTMTQDEAALELQGYKRIEVITVISNLAEKAKFQGRWGWHANSI